MISIAPNDLPKIQANVSDVIKALSVGMQRVEQTVDLGDILQPLPVEIVGYWVDGMMRIDIKLEG